MRHILTGVAIASTVFFLLGAYALCAHPLQAAAGDLTASPDLRQIKKFISVEVQTQGTAERLGLSGAELTDLTRVTFLKNVPGIALEVASGPAADGAEPPSHLGFLTCEVWTVGELQIVAYHIDCNAGSYLVQKTPATLWNRAILGYGPKDEVVEAVRKGVRTMVELFGATFTEAKAGGGARESR